MQDREVVKSALEPKRAAPSPPVYFGGSRNRHHQGALGDTGLTCEAEAEAAPWKIVVGMTDKYGGDNAGPNPGVFWAARRSAPASRSRVRHVGRALERPASLARSRRPRGLRRPRRTGRGRFRASRLQGNAGGRHYRQRCARIRHRGHAQHRRTAQLII